jgi:hypothetical protein
LTQDWRIRAKSPQVAEVAAPAGESVHPPLMELFARSCGGLFRLAGIAIGCAPLLCHDCRKTTLIGARAAKSCPAGYAYV